MGGVVRAVALSRRDLERRRLVVVGLVLAVLASVAAGAPQATPTVLGAAPNGSGGSIWYVALTGPASATSSCNNPDFSVATLGAEGAIEAAILAASTGDTIHLCIGSFNLTTGQVDVTKDGLIFEGESTADTIVNGGSTYRLFDATGNTVTFRGLTLTNGKADGSSGGAVWAAGVSIVGAKVTGNTATFLNTGSGAGGAIYATGDVHIATSEFSGNTSTDIGGAIYAARNIAVTDGTFTDNSAGQIGGAIFSGEATDVKGSVFRSNRSWVEGGAIHAGLGLTVAASTFGTNISDVGGAIGTSFTVSITDSDFSANTALTRGGAISTGSVVEVTNGTFTDNSAGAAGGAIYTAYKGAVVTTAGTYQRNHAEGNDASLDGGGAIYAKVVTVIGGEFLQNTARQDGGAIRAAGHVRIIGADLTGNTSLSGNGGALWASSGIEISGATFVDNSASRYGGAIQADDNDDDTPAADVAITDGTFIRNRAPGSDGGAIHVGSQGSLSIDGGRFEANFGQWGGAIRVKGDARISGAEFLDNTGGSGGGGAIYANCHLVVDGGSFTGNAAPNGKGGAIYGESGSWNCDRSDRPSDDLTLEIQGANFSSSTAKDAGGAIYSEEEIAITDGTFTDNSSGAYGGAIAANGLATIHGSTFAYNRGGGDGGALFASGIDATNSTFVGNVILDYNDEALGGAIYGIDDVTAAYSTFIDNSTDSSAVASGGEALFSNNGTLTVDHVLIVGSGGSSECDADSPPTDLGGSVQTGTGCVSAPDSQDSVSRTDIHLGTFANHGGPTSTYSLSDGSVAIDVDGSETCSVDSDQRGIARPQGDGCDAGAYEASGTSGPGAYIVGIGAQSCTAYATIRAAAAAADDGETVHVCEGIHHLSKPVLVADKDLTFEATSGTTTVIDGGGTSRLFLGNLHLSFVWLTLRNAYTTGDGGAVRTGDVSVAHSVFSDNTAGGGGGAIYADGSVDITTSTFVSNSSGDDGGAIYATLTNPVAVRQSTFTGNRALAEGGAIYLGGSASGGPISIQASTFNGNQAAGGGAVYGGTGTVASVVNSTFYENTANIGDGGAFAVQDLDATNATFVRNAAGGVGDHVTAVTIDAVDSIFSDGDCSVTTIGTDSGNVTTDAATCPDGDASLTYTTGDLNLGPLGPWGGPTRTVKLRSPSAALDVHASPCSTGTDQRGAQRPQGDCDAGAFELTTTTVTYTGPSLVFIGTATTGRVTVSGTTFPALAGCDLRFTITDSGTGLWTYDATTGLKGVGSALTDALPVGTYSVTVSPLGDCGGAFDASGNFAIVPDNIGKGTAGGGSYKLPNTPNGLTGPIRFSHVVLVKSATSKVGRTSVTTVTTKGSLLWTYKNVWRLKAKIDYSSTDGTTSTWGTFTCPPEATTGSICGRFSGAALLQVWNGDLGQWVASDYTNVTFVVTVYDGGTKSVCSKNKCTSTTGPDYFGVQIKANGLAVTTADGIPVSVPIRLGTTGSLKAN